MPSAGNTHIYNSTLTGHVEVLRHLAGVYGIKRLGAVALCENYSIPAVPATFRGASSPQAVQLHADGYLYGALATSGACWLRWGRLGDVRWAFVH